MIGTAAPAAPPPIGYPPAGPPPIATAQPAGSPEPGQAPRPSRRGMPAFWIRQVILAEIVAGLLVVAASRHDWTIVPAGLGAVLFVVLMLVRSAGRPVYSAVQTRVHYLLRGRTRIPAAGPDPRLAPIQEISGSLEFSAVQLRTGSRLGICFDGTGWVAALAVHRDGDMVLGHTPQRRLPLRLLAETLVVDDIRLSSVQVLTLSSPPWTGGTDPGQPELATVSYGHLNGGWGAGRSQTWVVLRLDARNCPEAIEARGGGSLGAERALKRCAARAIELLDASGVPIRPLGDDALAGLLADTAGTPAAGPPDGMRRTKEHWRSLETDDLTHITWRVRSWPAPAAPGAPGPMELLDQVGTAGWTGRARFSVTSLVLLPGEGDQVRFFSLLRICAPMQDLAEAAATAVGAAAASAGIGVRRLDGEHAAGFAATLPLGGGTW